MLPTVDWPRSKSVSVYTFWNIFCLHSVYIFLFVKKLPQFLARKSTAKIMASALRTSTAQREPSASAWATASKTTLLFAVKIKIVYLRFSKWLILSHYVVASNNETYTNECEVRLKSCYAGKNWFIKSLTACQNVASPYSSYGRSSSSVSSAPPLSSSFSSTSGRHYSSSPSSSSPSGSSSYSYSYRTSDSRSPASSSSQSLPLLPPPPYSPRDQNRPDTSRSYSRTVTTNTITRSYSS